LLANKISFLISQNKIFRQIVVFSEDCDSHSLSQDSFLALFLQSTEGLNGWKRILFFFWVYIDEVSLECDSPAPLNKKVVLLKAASMAFPKTLQI
jgi:hypothetical protein